MSQATSKNTTTTSRRSIAADGLAMLGLDPVVTLWAKVRALDAEHAQIDAEQNALRVLIESRNPGWPRGMHWMDWHRDDPDAARCHALWERSNKLCDVSSRLWAKIAATQPRTTAGVRAKVAAALHAWEEEKHLEEETWLYDLILNALREAAAGSAA